MPNAHEGIVSAGQESALRRKFRAHNAIAAYDMVCFATTTADAAKDYVLTVTSVTYGGATGDTVPAHESYSKVAGVASAAVVNGSEGYFDTFGPVVARKRSADILVAGAIATLSHDEAGCVATVEFDDEYVGYFMQSAGAGTTSVKVFLLGRFLA
jgi:hypothetical protein